MIQIGVFSYRATDSRLAAKFDALMNCMDPYIDREGWDTKKHRDMLRARVMSKMAVIRKKLLTERRIVRQGSICIEAPQGTRTITSKSKLELTLSLVAEMDIKDRAVVLYSVLIQMGIPEDAFSDIDHRLRSPSSDMTAHSNAQMYPH